MTSDIHATWAYDWNDDPLENSFVGTAPAGVDLVAMFNSMSDYSSLTSSSYKEVIGWNEPDGSAAPVSSTTASQDWPRIAKTVGKRMDSPVSAHTSLTEGDWFYDFVTNVIKAGSPPDFICLHCYSPDGDVSSFQSYVEGVYNMYKLPILGHRMGVCRLQQGSSIHSKYCRPGGLYAGGGENVERVELCRTLRLVRSTMEQCSAGK